MITPKEAWAATDPSHDDDARKASAQAIMAGVAANDAYYNSRGELEQIIAAAKGGQVVTHESLNPPAGSVPPAVEGTAEEEQAELSGGAATEDKLRAQIKALGGTPEA
jgi:hypothetical protein